MGFDAINLPESWHMVRIGDVGDVITGRTPRTKRPEFYGGDYNLISPADLDNGKYVITAHKKLTLIGFDECRALPKDTVLVGCIGNVGKLGMIFDERSATNQQINAIICNKNNDPHFIYYCFHNNRSRLEQAADKTTLPILNKTNFENFEIAVPPLVEQRKIAGVLGVVQRAIEQQEQLLQQTTELKKTLLHQLLTHGLRGEPQKQTEIGLMPENWEVVLLGDVFETQLGKMLSKKARTGNDPKPYLRNANVQWGYIDISDMLKMDFNEREKEKFLLRSGDLLVCEGGVPGRAAVWKGEINECYYQKALHRLRPKDGRATNQFLAYWLMFSFELQNLCGVAGASSTIAHLPEVQLKALPIPVPERSQQEEICDVVRQVDMRVDVLARKRMALSDLLRILLHQLMTAQIRVHDLPEVALCLDGSLP